MFREEGISSACRIALCAALLANSSCAILQSTHETTLARQPGPDDTAWELTLRRTKCPGKPDFETIRIERYQRDQFGFFERALTDVSDRAFELKIDPLENRAWVVGRESRKTWLSADFMTGEHRTDPAAQPVWTK